MSNKAFTNQMIGQQLILLLNKETGSQLSGYFKQHKLIVYSTDYHWNHQIFVRKAQLCKQLADRIATMFGVTIVIKDIIFVARTVDV